MMIIILIVVLVILITRNIRLKGARALNVLPLLITGLLLLFMQYAFIAGIISDDNGWETAEEVYEEPELPSGVSEDYDLPAGEVPELHPDALGISELEYESTPVFDTGIEVSTYMLNRMLNDDMEFDFYMSRELARDKRAAEKVTASACENSMSYYMFGSFGYGEYYDDRGEDEGIYASVKIEYTDPDLDLEAKAEALEYIVRHPVPEGGFTSYEQEKKYARGIHDFIADKISYSEIGYDFEMMESTEDMYEAKQEAYNSLAEDQNDAVCAGYARGFGLIAQYAGIDCSWVWNSSDDEESHAWNVIYPCDGSEPVVVDVTWDDGDSGGCSGQGCFAKEIYHDYFYLPVSEADQHSADREQKKFIDHLHDIVR